MKSYVETRLGPLARLNELYNLYVKQRSVSENVQEILQEVRDSKVKISSVFGAPVTGLRILEIGPGQQLAHLAYFGVDNNVVGIDFDVILQQLNIKDCVRMVRQNGWMRTGKTVGRKIARIDSNIRGELASQLGLKKISRLPVMRMDAGNMAFADNEFDVVYSRAVFEHLADPVSVVSEIRRVLKPGGVMFVRLHLFTSDSGCHDTRIFVEQRDELPFWSHLRQEYKQRVRPNTYLNKLRLAEWVEIFHSGMPGSKVVALCDANETEHQELRKLRSNGELQAYSDEELLSPTVEASWQKPSEPLPRAAIDESSRLPKKQEQTNG